MNRSAMTQTEQTPRSLAERGPRNTLWKILVLGGMLAAWAYVFLVGEDGWLDLRSEREKLASMEWEVSRLQAQNDSLRLVLERMENDPDFLEKVAREQFGMIKPGEHLYRITRPDAKGD